MQPVIRGKWGICVRLAVAWLALVFATGCGWEKTMAFPSPSRKSTIEVLQTRFANEWGIRVEIVAGKRRTKLYERRGETIIYFVHVYWSPDESTVALLATGSPIFGVAFDENRGKQIPFGQIRNEIGESIRETYHVPAGNDPVAWAALSEAQHAFARRHPEIRLSYK
jgi:hypothetical protein